MKWGISSFILSFQTHNPVIVPEQQMDYSFSCNISLSDVVDIENDFPLSQNSEVDNLGDILDTSFESLQAKLIRNNHDDLIFQTD